MIALEGLVYTYPDGGFTLRVDDLQVDAGASLAVTGPSGSGKTTLLHCLAGLLPAPAERCRVAGVDLPGLGETARRAFRRRRVGLVFQDARLLEHLSVRDNILVTAHCAGLLRPLGVAAERCRILAERLGIAALLPRRADRISRGEAQRAAIARALLPSPAVVLADEPTAGLDVAAAGETAALLHATAREQGAALVVATHDAASRDRCDAWHRLGGDGP